MLAKIPNPGRPVPVPRRMLRALAGGFNRAVMAVIIATLIRSLFWHRTLDAVSDRRDSNLPRISSS